MPFNAARRCSDRIQQASLPAARVTLWHRLAICAALITLLGCSKPAGPRCYPVRGTVTQDGKPVAEVMVVLHPLLPQTEPFPLPLGHTDEQGNFHLQTLRPGDGAPAGEYAITLELRALRRSGEEMTRDGKNLLPARYATPQSTPLHFRVIEGENKVPAIAITPR